MTKRQLYFISDGTGITAETLGRSLMTQFAQVDVDTVTVPYLSQPEKAQQFVEQVEQVFQQSGTQPIIFATLVNPEIRQIIKTSPAIFLDLFEQAIDTLEQVLGCQASRNVGLRHSLSNMEGYGVRIDAVNFALDNDDGAGKQNYHDADVILVGVSRCGKTPTSLYLAMQFGIKAANYPFIAEDMEHLSLNDKLRNNQNKLFGLTISSKQLHAIRNERRPNSHYASLHQCRLEVAAVEKLLRQEQILHLNTTTRSIEEIATQILEMTGIQRRLC